MAYPARSERRPKSGRSPATAPAADQPLKQTQSRAGSPRHDPPLRQFSPKWGSTDVEGDLVKEKENQKPIVTTKENQPTLPRAVIQTPKSDVRTIDKQSDLETTHISAANKHYRGWLIPISINQISTLALLDTGATCTMIGRPLYETLQAVQPLKVKQHWTCIRDTGRLKWINKT